MDPLTWRIVEVVVVILLIVAVASAALWKYYYERGPADDTPIVMGEKEVNALTADKKTGTGTTEATEPSEPSEPVITEPFLYTTTWRTIPTASLRIIGNPDIDLPKNAVTYYYVQQCSARATREQCEQLADRLSGLPVSAKNIVVKDSEGKFYTLYSYSKGTHTKSYLRWNDKLSRFVLAK